MALVELDRSVYLSFVTLQDFPPQADRVKQVQGNHQCVTLIQ